MVDSFFRGHLKHLFYSVSHPMGQEFGQEAAGWGFSSHWQQQSSSGGISGWAGRLGSGLVDISHGGSEPEGQCSHKQVVVFPQTRSHKQTSHDATFCLTLLVREVTGPPWFKERDHVLKSRTSPATLNKKIVLYTEQGTYIYSERPISGHWAQEKGSRVTAFQKIGQKQPHGIICAQ